MLCEFDSRHFHFGGVVYGKHLIKRSIFGVYRLLMIDFVKHFFSQLWTYLVAPLYFHFGHCDLFIDLCVFLCGLSESNYFFFTVFAVSATLALFKDMMLKCFTESVLKNVKYENYLPNHVYVNFFLNLYYNTLTILKNIFFLFVRIK